MTSLSLTTDESVEIHLTAPVGRNFDLAIDLHRDLTGDSFRMEVHADDGTTLLTLTSADGITQNGTVLTLTRDYTDMALPSGVYRYDLVQLSPGRVDTLCRGNFILTPTVTRL